MSITINHIQSLLSTYHRQQVRSRLSDAGAGHRKAHSEPNEDRVFLSTEAKRMQIYQKTAEQVLSRLMHPAKNEDNGKEAAIAVLDGKGH
jgi:hypothetical protein